MDPHKIDVTGTLRNSFLENAHAFIDQRINQPLVNLLIAEFTACDVQLAASIDNQFFNVRIRNRRARSGFVSIIACAGLLPEPPRFTQCIVDRRHFTAVFSGTPADIETCEISHRKRTHHAKLPSNSVDLLRKSPFKQHFSGLANTREKHAIADKAKANADDHWHLSNT